MADVTLHIDDPATRISVKTMLEAAGHRIVPGTSEIVVSDLNDPAVLRANEIPTLVLCTAAELPRAVSAMRRGVFGYVFLPLQPGEVEVMVERALSWRTPEPKPESEALQDGSVATLADIEREHVLRVLRACKFNRSEAARVLGIGRNTLWRKLRQYKR